VPIVSAKVQAAASNTRLIENLCWVVLMGAWWKIVDNN